MSLIKGIHHVSMKCESAEEYQKVISFYKEVLEIPVARQWSEAQFVKVDIKDAKYLKLRADDNGTAWWTEWYDEAVYADAKLIKESYVEDTSKIDFIKTTV